jgi:glyoxylate/hydroxypyruvate reductase
MKNGTLDVLIATPFEAENVAFIERSVVGIKVWYRPDLLPKPRYEGDHDGEPRNLRDEELSQWLQLMSQAEVMLGLDFADRAKTLKRAPRLRWIQGTSAGMGKYVAEAGLLNSDILVTTASGIHGRQLAEFVLLSVLFFTKDVLSLQQHQRAHRWERRTFKQLEGKRAAIIGLGHVGRCVATLLTAAGVQVMGCRRSSGVPPEGVLTLFAPNELHDVLPQVDFLVIATPATPETDGLIGHSELARMPPHAVIINIARGSVVDESALVEALLSGRLAGAALDVFKEEPLSASSPLWDIRNVLISPHSASTAPGENRKIAELFVENLQRFRHGHSLINVFNRQRQY